jgi:hypothetical protein
MVVLPDKLGLASPSQGKTGGVGLALARGGEEVRYGTKADGVGDLRWDGD